MEHQSGDSRERPSKEADPRRRLVTDGGRDSELPRRESPAFGSTDPDDDPFVWAGEHPASDDRSEQSGEADTGVDDADGEEAPGLSVPDEGPGPSDESAGADRDESGDDAPTAEVRTVKECAERLSELAEDLNLKAINASLKHARDEDEGLETIHDELEIYADRLTKEIEELEDAIEDIEEPNRRWRSTTYPGLTSIPGLNLGRTERRPLLSSAPAVLRTDSPGGTLDDGDDDQSTGSVPVKTNGAAVNGHSPESATAIEPLDFLIPGVELRDMWRADEVDYTNTSHDAEWWVLETTPRSLDGDESREFPPEVTEFALDPDEVPFEDLLEDVEDE